MEQLEINTTPQKKFQVPSSKGLGDMKRQKVAFSVFCGILHDDDDTIRYDDTRYYTFKCIPFYNAYLERTKDRKGMRFGLGDR